jgi:hypothetical protein
VHATNKVQAMVRGEWMNGRMTQAEANRRARRVSGPRLVALLD